MSHAAWAMLVTISADTRHIVRYAIDLTIHYSYPGGDVASGWVLVDVNVTDQIMAGGDRCW